MLLQIPIVFGYRKPLNLGDHLIRSDLPTLGLKKKHLPPKCNMFPKCKHCPRINKSGKITSTSTNREFKIPKKVSCNSTNLVYCIECNMCNIQYVGQTKNKLLTRINQHRSDVRTKKDTPVSRHFNKHPLDYTIYVLQIVYGDLTNRLKIEDYWMSRLYSLAPKGLNILD